ncbi:thermonuclease family protein [Shewanella indica]|uniref:thermonuclease family protein n=2 Tax=Shewanella indica TaxID=768528 RepID=UPI002044CDDF|nr:thermonuclease family protein [Shewanella indica]
MISQWNHTNSGLGTRFWLGRYLMNCLLLLGCFLSLGSAQASIADNLCIPYTASEKVTLAYINDGDTLTLKDGRLIRLIGVNAPEIDHQYPGLSQPYSMEARAFVASKLKVGDELALMFGSSKLDPYGRTLAYVFTPNGLLLQQELLQQGFAMARVYQEHPFWECFAELEQQARTQNAGLWQFEDYAPKATSAIGQQDLNQYRLVRGVVTDFERKGQYLWLILDDNFYVGIPQAGSGNFSKVLALNSLKRAVVVRGKLYFSYKKWQIIVSHPSQISFENPP